MDQAANRLPRACLELFDSPTVGLILLSSVHMWSELGLSSRVLHDKDGPVLNVACRPVFFDEVMPLESLVRIYSSDLEDDRRYLADIQKTLRDFTPTRLTAPGGTDIVFTCRDWGFHGRELLTSPFEETVHGTIVADASVYLGRVTRPITLTIERGRVTNIRCPDPSDPVFRLFRLYRQEMDDRFRLTPADCQLAEVGLGGNGGARLSGHIMEDESVRGTCHFCFGDNCRYGGTNYSTWHGGTVVVGGVQITQPSSGLARRA